MGLIIEYVRVHVDIHSFQRACMYVCVCVCVLHTLSSDLVLRGSHMT